MERMNGINSEQQMHDDGVEQLDDASRNWSAQQSQLTSTASYNLEALHQNNWLSFSALRGLKDAMQTLTPQEAEMLVLSTLPLIVRAVKDTYLQVVMRNLKRDEEKERLEKQEMRKEELLKERRHSRPQATTTLVHGQRVYDPNSLLADTIRLSQSV